MGWVGSVVWLMLCGGGGVKNVYFRSVLGWGCGVICVIRFEGTHSKLECILFLRLHNISLMFKVKNVGKKLVFGQ